MDSKETEQASLSSRIAALERVYLEFKGAEPNSGDCGGMPGEPPDLQMCEEVCSECRCASCTFGIGDVVTLKSGGQLMTVVGVEECEATGTARITCQWFSECCHGLAETSFDSRTLEIAEI